MNNNLDIQSLAYDTLMEMISKNPNFTLEDFNKEFEKVYNTDFDIKKIKISFVNKSNNKNPEFATNGSSGFDIRAHLEKPVIVKNNGGIEIIPTGLYFQLQPNFEIQIRPRSGLAAKHGVTVLNSPGTIDSDYRGELKIILINHGKSDFEINNGDRISQGVINTILGHSVIELTQVDEIYSDTDRSEGGFGSTGIK